MIKTKIVILIIFFGFVMHDCFSQAFNTVISGIIDIGENGDQIQIDKSVDRFFNYFNTDENDNSILNNKKFTAKFFCTPNTFIRLQSKGLPKFICYVDSFSDINFRVITDSISKKQTVIFDGLNARGNELMVNRKLLNNAGEDQLKIVNIIKLSPNSVNALDSLHLLLSHYTNQLKNLYAKHEITKNCLSSLVAETEQRLLFWCMGIFNEGLKNPTALKMDKNELIILIKDMYYEFDPFNSKYLSTTSIQFTAQYKCQLIKDQILQSDFKQHNDLWINFTKQFSEVDGGIGLYDYAPEFYQCIFIGNDLLTARAFNAIPNEEFLKLFKTYYSVFPQSPYSTVITGLLLLDIVKNEKPINDAMEKLMYLDSSENIISIAIDKYSNIDSLVKKVFKGKPVFVDYWATYCTPCLAEFKYEQSLNLFLKRNNIIMLYVSLDIESNESNWLKFIKSNKLRGYHLLTNNTTKNLLNKQFSGIPRYMIYNQDGQLLEKDAFRPSSQKELYDQINQLLKKNQ